MYRETCKYSSLKVQRYCSVESLLQFILNIFTEMTFINTWDQKADERRINIIPYWEGVES